MTVRRALSQRGQERGQNIGGFNWFGQFADPAVIPPNAALGKSVAGVAVNERTVLSLGAVFSCLRILADTAAGIENHVYRKTSIGNADIEVDLPDVIADPYADMTARAGNVQSVVSFGLGGNLYRQVIDRDDDGNPVQIEILNPTLLNVKLVGGVKTYQVGVTGPVLNPKDIVHVKFLEGPGGIVGFNPIEMGAGMFGIAQASEEYASRFFSQGIQPGGILSINKPLQPNDAQRYQQELAVNHAGIANAYIPLVIDAETKWTQIAVNPETAQLLESREFSKSEIAGSLVCRWPSWRTTQIVVELRSRGLRNC